MSYLTQVGTAEDRRNALPKTHYSEHSTSKQVFTLMSLHIIRCMFSSLPSCLRPLLCTCCTPRRGHHPCPAGGLAGPGWCRLLTSSLESGPSPRLSALHTHSRGDKYTTDLLLDWNIALIRNTALRVLPRESRVTFIVNNHSF